MPMISPSEAEEMAREVVHQHAPELCTLPKEDAGKSYVFMFECVYVCVCMYVYR